LQTVTSKPPTDIRNDKKPSDKQMTITINQRGGTYYIYKDFMTKGQEHDYTATDTSSGWAWDGKEAHIYDKDKKELGYVWFNLRLFRTSQLQFILTENGKPTTYEPENVWNWVDRIFKFNYNGSTYVFQEHRGHSRSLFKNDLQVAAFEKRMVRFFERDVYTIHANKDENPILLSALALYSDIGVYDDIENKPTVTFNFGNIIGSAPPLNGKWRPTKI